MVGRAQKSGVTKRYGEYRQTYSVMGTYDLIYWGLHPGGKSVMFKNPINDKPVYPGLRWITIMRNKQEAVHPELGELVQVRMPEWLAEKLKLI